MKTCSVCKTNKPASDFHRASGRTSGRVSACYTCVSKRRAGKHKKNRDPIKEKSRSMLRHAIQSELIIKPDNCQNCEIETPKELLDGHHHNGYNRPLDVLWLCRRCHAGIEAGFIKTQP